MIEVGWYVGLLGHRTAEEIPEIVERFRACGVTAEILEEVLSDPNRLLHSPDRDGEQWAQQYGGPAGAALLVSELLTYLAHQHRMAARIQLDLASGHAVSPLHLVHPAPPATGDVSTEGPTP